MVETVLLILTLWGLLYVFPPLLYLATERPEPPRTRRLPPDALPSEVKLAIAGWRSEFGESRLSLVAAHAMGEGAANVLHFVEPGTGVHALHYLTPQHRWVVFLDAPGRRA